MSVKKWCRTNGVCEQTYYRKPEKLICSLLAQVEEKQSPILHRINAVHLSKPVTSKTLTSKSSSSTMNNGILPREKLHY
jgi:hypothetical protein